MSATDYATLILPPHRLENSNNPDFQKINKVLWEEYLSNQAFEDLFPYEEVSELKVMYEKQLNSQYGQGAINELFNGDDKLLKYTRARYIEGEFTLDETFTYARTITPIEKAIKPEVWIRDLSFEPKFKKLVERGKLMKVMQENGAYTPLTIKGTWTTKEEFLEDYDKWLAKCLELGINPTQCINYCSYAWKNAVRNYIQLITGADSQIMEVIKKYNATMTFDGILFIAIADKVPFIEQDGTPSTITYLKDGVHIISVETTSEVEVVKMRKLVDTPLRVGIGAIGTGKGNVWYAEEIVNYGGRIIEPKKVILGIDETKYATSDYKVSLTNARNNYTGNFAVLVDSCDIDSLLRELYKVMAMDSRLHLVDATTVKLDGTAPTLTPNSVNNVVIKLVPFDANSIFVDSCTVMVEAIMGPAPATLTNTLSTKQIENTIDKKVNELKNTSLSEELVKEMIAKALEKAQATQEVKDTKKTK